MALGELTGEDAREKTLGGELEGLESVRPDTGEGVEEGLMAVKAEVAPLLAPVLGSVVEPALSLASFCISRITRWETWPKSGTEWACRAMLSDDMVCWAWWGGGVGGDGGLV